MKVTGTNVSMTRGDSESITVTMKNTEGELVPFEDGDLLYFTIKENINTESKILQKAITIFRDGSALIGILPEDTKSLRCKEYVYDIQLNRIDGTVSTIIKPSKFVIEGEVTYE